MSVVLSQQLTPASCFSGVTTGNAFRTNERSSSTIRTATRLSFRNSRDNVALLFENPQGVAARLPGISRSRTDAQSPRQQRRASLPTWLATPKGHLAKSNLEALETAMRSNGLCTEKEIDQLVQAIEQAAGGDANKIAGAAEFCLLMVETMEMRIHSLTAAAFHYCSCVTARERSLVSRTATPANMAFRSSLLSTAATESFGDSQATQIALDAARLKQLELLADTVTNKGNPTNSDHAETLLQLYLSETQDWRALAIRSAACLYRLRGLLKHAADTGASHPALTPESVRVCKEALHVYAPLASRLGMHRLKNELEDAGFRILYRRQYETVTALTQQVRNDQQSGSISESMNQVMARVQQDMTSMLEQDGVFASAVDSFSVTARVKEPYSLWKKMLVKRFDHILDVPDAIAVRIVLNAKPLSSDESDQTTEARERALCYYAQKLCTERWRPVADDARFKDYIANPKPNGYQSLHYTAATEWAGEEWTLEMQVRSGKMHQVAEFGVASHWSYKKQQKSKRQSSSVGQPAVQLQRQPSSGDALLNGLDSLGHSALVSARRQRLEPYIQALNHAKSDLQKFVFVFLTHDSNSSNDSGELVALPAGACVKDALKEGEKLVHSLLGLNGVPTSVARKLRNGDVLNVPLSAPSLSYA